MFTESQKQWLRQINEQLPAYLRRLTSDAQVGRFLPCEKGATALGKKLALGYSCFALKAYYMLGLWDALDESKQKAWIRFIKSYQVRGQYASDPATQNAFVDEPLILFHQPRFNLRQTVRQFMKPQTIKPQSKINMQRAVFAETKQALATLAEIDESPDLPYPGFMQTPEALQAFLASLNWMKPWGAGGQASAQVVFIKTQGPTVVGKEQTRELLQVCDHWFESLADANTGLYFGGSDPPPYGQAINGAMKVLTALDWLETPIHYPKQLIDACLTELPSAAGCHLVDTVYVLYRCLQYTSYRRQDVESYCTEILDMIRKHHNADGGFSYSIGKSQTGYYGARITKGVAESDIHGTILLTWAVAIILHIMKDNFLNWKVIRP
ncbi:MAG TPA: hypothetical protein VK206_26860 [Anaerolineales bacterium]|nr:hypothetical protein [Anaerolineales bacterium]